MLAKIPAMAPPRCLLLLLALAAIVASPLSARAADCTAKDFATVVDESGATLRAMTLAAQPKLQDRMRRYKEAKNLNDGEYENAALDAIQDATLTKYDEQSGELVLRVDVLGRVPEGSEPDCAKLNEVRLAAAELNEVIKAKSDYMLKRLDDKISEAEGSGASPQNKKSETVAVAAPPAPVPAVRPPLKPSQPTESAQSGKPQKAEASPPKSKPAPAAPPVVVERAPAKPNDAYVPPAVAALEPNKVLMTPDGPEADGYSIDEIREATRGFFGTVSTSLASVIEHAFKQAGRPTAYVLGTEGGGAFLAGLRYGEGTLYMRSRPDTYRVYWHGPSLGTDFGASGSRTMFLIYRLHEPGALYRSFTGVDGSAYFVGGVGLTLLKGGQVIMAPIRSGVGLRIGANIGYVAFTDRPTWNPF